MTEQLRLILLFFFLFLGCIEIIISIVGLIKLKTLYFKIHAASKIPTTGILFISIGLVIYSNTNFLKILLIIFCLFFSSSLSNHIISRIDLKK